MLIVEASEQSQRANDAAAKNLDRFADAWPARRAQSVRVRASHEDRASAESDCFDDVAATSNAAVQVDFGATGNGVDYFGQGEQRRRHAVELPAAVIRDDDRVGAGIECATRVFVRRARL